MRQKDPQCQVAYPLQRISSVYYERTFGICFFQTFYAAFFSQIYFLEKNIRLSHIRCCFSITYIPFYQFSFNIFDFQKRKSYFLCTPSCTIFFKKKLHFFCKPLFLSPHNQIGLTINLTQ